MLTVFLLTVTLVGCRGASGGSTETGAETPNTGGDETFLLPDSMVFTDCFAQVGDTLTVSDFVTGIPDSITVSFVSEPNTSAFGTYTVILSIQSGTQTVTRPVTLMVYHVKQTLSVSTALSDFSHLKPADFIDADTQTLQKLNLAFENFDASAIRVGVAANYPVAISVNGVSHNVTLSVAHENNSTTIVHNLETVCGVLPSPADFLEISKEQAKELKIEYETSPDVSVPGQIPVRIVMTDSFGNQTVLTAQLTIHAENDMPIFNGLNNFYILTGDTISYKNGVTAIDNVGNPLTFQVDSSKVDRHKAGVYPVTYTATDSAGNTTKKTVHVYVNELTEEYINSLCDEVINKVIKSNMSRDQKIEAVWKYTKRNVLYVGTSDKNDVLRNIYTGLKSGIGDCYTYYCINRRIFNRLGIPNLEVRRVNGKTNHWWNLVQFEDGLWYHVDSCPTPSSLSSYSTFKMTDDVIERYTEIVGNNRKYYNYDKTLHKYVGIPIAGSNVAPETSAPETEPPETSAPETEPPVTSAPETEPPVTSAPETLPPETSAPETDPPVTSAPETVPPVTSVPETDPSVTTAPETEPPVTGAPETVPPVTSAPAESPESELQDGEE